MSHASLAIVLPAYNEEARLESALDELFGYLGRRSEVARDGAPGAATLQPDGSDMRRSQPLFRRLLGRAFHFLASAWVAGPVQDTQCGFKGFSRSAAKDLFARQVVTSIVFDVELIYLARRRGYRMTTVPVRWNDRRGSRMRARPGLAIRVAWDLFRIPLIHRRIGRAQPLTAAARSHDKPADQ